MGSKPKAPDMSFQIEAAQKQEAELARQRAETDLKNQQVSMANTDKLKGLRRRQAGRGMMGAPENTYVPAGAPTPVAAPRFRASGRRGLAGALERIKEAKQGTVIKKV